jgi:exosortase
MDTASVIETQPSDELQMPSESAGRTPPDWLGQLLRSPLFVPMVFVGGSLGWLYWHLITRLPRLWLADDGYYSHGFLVPLIAGYVVVKKWDRIRTIPVKAGWLAIPFMFGFAYLAYVTTHTNISAILALSFLCSVLTGIWFAAGWRWMVALAGPVLYLGFALPLWTGAIEFYTNPAQLASTTVAFQILKAIGFGPMKFPADPTTIYLSHFTLDIAVPCSGLKLMLAVSAFTIFFMMIASLKWWGNLAMVFIVLPLCVFVNGLRIAMIGMVGDQFGSDAGHQFHDWSGYLMLLICFFTLFKFARGLGWKD